MGSRSMDPTTEKLFQAYKVAEESLRRAESRVAAAVELFLAGRATRDELAKESIVQVTAMKLRDAAERAYRHQA